MAAYMRVDPVNPLPVNTRSDLEAPPTFGTSTFRYPEPLLPRHARTHGQSQGQAQAQAHSSQQNTNGSVSRARAQSVGISGQSQVAPAAPTPTLYVRALYDYETDDRTSLTFHQGDTIQVITQLASGWWDGILDGVRGWFPSNYCVVVPGPDNAPPSEAPNLQTNGEVSGDSSTDDDFVEEAESQHRRPVQRNGEPRAETNTAEHREQEVAACWIPQATPDGRLFYFNTLTGVSTMELPLETPTSANETGPRGMNVNLPDQTRPPPEMMAGGMEREESEYDDQESASELDESLISRNGRRRRSFVSDGVSPAASQESFNASPATQTRGFDNQSTSMHAVAQAPLGMPINTAVTSFTSNPLGQINGAPLPRCFSDDGIAVPVTWNKLVENICRAVESYRQAINNADRSEYVRKAEDISDHLRMLLAAASGTTDNHSGNPSIISTNKALYPHFRDMMSRFSKLVLSSHIAAADWPAPDAYSKCLQEAEGVLHGVYGYVEVARTQRGEDIPRIVPGFVMGSSCGGSWQNNSLGTKESMLATSFMEDEYEQYPEPTISLDGSLLIRIDELKRMLVSNIRRLEEHLALREKLITPMRHEKIGNAVCQATTRVIETFRPWINTVESIDLSSFNSSFQNPQIQDFQAQKQRLYDLPIQLLLACQAVAAPLGDEWAEMRGEPLENRLHEVSTIVRQLESCTSQVGMSLQILLDVTPASELDTMKELRDAQIPPRHRSDGGTPYDPHTMPNIGSKVRPQLSDMNMPFSYSEGIDPAAEHQGRKQDNSKVRKFFGEVPRDIEQQPDPQFLQLDHDGEISYDTKLDPPQLRGGTLTALVEQLTRHDRLDSNFNNTFLLTYKSFTSAAELFELLVRRFNIQPPRGVSEDDYKTWVDKKQKPIRYRVVNILKSWFDNYWMEDNNETSNELLRRVYSFAKDTIATTATPGSAPLMASVERRMRGQDPNAKSMVPTPSASMPTPIMPKNMKKLKFLDIDATEFARQLTIIESRLYFRIKPSECLNKTWSRKGGPDDPDPAPTVKALILHANQLTNWVAEMILNQSEVKKRVYVIKHFVSVADVRPLIPRLILSLS